MEDSNIIIIKKYPNRRLYNTKESAYITVKNVAEIITEGFRVKVVDVTTGEDVTALVLTQIIMNKAKENQELLPVSLLHLAIQFGESHLHDFFDNYLEKTMENYLIYRKKMDDQVNAYMGMGMGFSNLAGKTFKDMEQFDMFSDIFKQYKETEKS